MTRGKASVRVVFDPAQFQEKGFDGEIAEYMRKHTNTAIVGDVPGVDRHVIQFADRASWMNHTNKFAN